MKKTAFILTIIISLALTGVAPAADTKVHVITGEVMQVTAAMVKIRGAVRNMEFSRDANTKVNGDLKKNAKVTITYNELAGMPHATQVDVISK